MRALFLSLLVACSSSATTLPAPVDAGVAQDALIDSSQLDASVDKAATCASSFGAELTNAFGRLDGTILAVVAPGNATCAQPNGTHLVLQVTMHGAAYRMVINVSGNPPDPTVSLAELDAPLAGGAWSEGWHAPVALDYVTTLAIKSTAFQPMQPSALVTTITSELTIGAHVSVFATSSGGAKADSAHLVHRNATNADGAIVVSPESPSAHYLLFRFADQAF